MEILSKIIGFVVLALGALFAFALIMAFPTKWLWNWLMPYLFALKTISVWQALGINILCGFLFRSSTTTKSKE